MSMKIFERSVGMREHDLLDVAAAFVVNERDTGLAFACDFNFTLPLTL